MTAYKNIIIGDLKTETGRSRRKVFLERNE
jgi:hypothetical protein